ncbi:hypothetical protein EMN47_08870 [Prolixibacteraceae bacterium JC049]|nr:hypothetical protein [Prolixibacteraceae bacterium JC049]
MLEKQDIQAHLQEIIKSKGFSRSNTNTTLLRFLVEATLNEKELKEVTIGHELFGQKYDPIKNDNKVRVYVHNLRKKLDEYYSKEGANSKIRFEIAKGQYKVAFNSATETTDKKKKYYFRWLMLFIPLAFCFSLWQLMQGKKSEHIWNAHFNSKKESKLLIGDHFTVEGPIATGGRGVFRDFDLNSSSDFSKHIKEHPELADQMIPNNYPYITKMGVYCSFDLSKWFHLHDTPLSVSIISDWDKNELSESNIIYVGQMKTMGLLKQVFLESYPTIESIRYGIVRKDPETNETVRYQSSAGDNIIDYTLVASMKGKNNNQLTFFLSENDIGVMNLVDLFLEADSLQQFYEKHDIENRDFVALFKVSGWERTGFERELIAVDVKK